MQRVKHLLAGIASAVPYMILVWTLIQVWVSPMSVSDGLWVRYAVGLMALEFIILHSGGFMGAMAASTESLKKRAQAFFGLFMLYSLFAYGFAKMVDSFQILYVYGFIMLGRFITIMIASGEGKSQILNRSAFGTMVYMTAVFGTLFIPVPELGVTHDVLEQVYPDRRGGEWEQNPEIAIAAGIFYFSVLALYELYLAWRMPEASNAASER